MSRRILVFPCGSEIGLEIHRALQFSTHFTLVGGSSVDDHGRFVFEDYVGGLPFHNAPGFVEALQQVIVQHDIDAIYPAMDAVADTLKRHEDTLGVRVIGSDARATAIAASKAETYAMLDGLVPQPAQYAALDQVRRWPIFIKPDVGYGSRHTLVAENADQAAAFLARHTDKTMLLLDYLPGQEWTIDCFSDRHGALRFHAARGRNRISNGISVNTQASPAFAAEFARYAQAINTALRPRGAWFFQMKADANGQPALLEVATRLGGSSGLFRGRGINFALLSAFDAFDNDVDLIENTPTLELDRALGNRYRLDYRYDEVFVDLDDCLIIREKVNDQLVAFLFRALSAGKRLILVTRHATDPKATLARHRLSDLFDQIVHIQDKAPKSTFIARESAIFIDDSFAERRDVAQVCGIPVFAPDMVEVL